MGRQGYGLNKTDFFIMLGEVSVALSWVVGGRWGSGHDCCFLNLGIMSDLEVFVFPLLMVVFFANWNINSDTMPMLEVLFRFWFILAK